MYIYILARALFREAVREASRPIILNVSLLVGANLITVVASLD